MILYRSYLAVAGLSIRLRILQAGAYERIFKKGCSRRSIDPTQDTARIISMRVESSIKSRRPIDPTQDTARGDCWINLVCSPSRRPIDPTEDTARGGDEPGNRGREESQAYRSGRGYCKIVFKNLEAGMLKSRRPIDPEEDTARKIDSWAGFKLTVVAGLSIRKRILQGPPMPERQQSPPQSQAYRSDRGYCKRIDLATVAVVMPSQAYRSGRGYCKTEIILSPFRYLTVAGLSIRQRILQVKHFNECARAMHPSQAYRSDRGYCKADPPG